MTALGCVDTEPIPPRDSGIAEVPVEQDAGVDAGVDAGRPDAGVTAGGLPVPDDTLVSIGITDNSGGVPQSAPILQLRFRNASPSAGTIAARRVSLPITLDGNSSDWIGVPESLVPLLARGASIGLTKAEWDQEYLVLNGRTQTWDFGISQLAVRAAYDDQRIYFLLQWADPTENRDRDTWFFDAGVFVRSKDNEDRAFLGFDINKSSPAFQAIGCSGACHLQERMGDVSDAGRAYRTRMHTNYPGEVIDYWSWRAATTDPMGAADDGYIDDVSRTFDGLNDWITINQTAVVPDAGLQPLLMSEYGVNANPIAIFKADAGQSPGIPFNAAGALLSARIPGWLMQRASVFRDDVSAPGATPPGCGRWSSRAPSPHRLAGVGGSAGQPGAHPDAGEARRSGEQLPRHQAAGDDGEYVLHHPDAAEQAGAGRRDGRSDRTVDRPGSAQ